MCGQSLNLRIKLVLSALLVLLTFPPQNLTLEAQYHQCVTEKVKSLSSLFSMF